MTALGPAAKAALATVALAFLLALAPAPCSAQESGAEATYWTRMISDKRKELASIEKAMPTYSALTDYSAQEFMVFVESDRVRFHQTSYMLTINEANPFEFKLACLELSLQTSHLRRRLAGIESFLDSSSRYLEIVKRSKTELEELQKLKQPPEAAKEIESTLVIIDKLLSGLNAIRDRLQKADSAGSALLALREQSLSGLKACLVNNLELTLMTSHGAVFDEDFLILAAIAFKHWVEKTPDSIVRKMPAGKASWILLLSLSAIVGMSLWFLMNRLLAPKLAAYEERKAGTAALLKRGETLLAAGAGLMTGCFSLPMQEHILPLHVGMTLVAAAALEGGWGLKLLFSKSTRKSSPLRALFFVAAAGVFLQAVDSQPVALVVLWTPLTALLAILSLKTLREPSEVLMPQQKIPVVITVALSIVSGLLSLCGLAALAVIIVKSWLLLALSFHFASASGAALRVFVEERENLGYVARSALLGFGIPLIWLSMTATSLLAIAWQIVDVPTCLNLLDSPFDLLGARLSLTALMTVVFLFFVVKTTLGVLCSTIDEKAGASLIEKEEVKPFKTLISGVLWSLYVIAVVKILGMDLSHMGVILGGLSVGLGFGMQNFVNNLVSGLMLLLGRDIREGDIIQIGETWAKVQKISLRSTIACTSDNAIISIPNSNILGSQVVNWTLNNKHIRKDLKLQVPAGGDVATTKGKLLAAASELHGVMQIPAPEVIVSTVAPAAVELTLRVWIADIEKSDQIISELNSRIDAGILHPQAAKA